MFNRRDGTPDLRAGVKAPLKPAHYEPPEAHARPPAPTTTRPSMPSAPAPVHVGAASSTHDVHAPARPATPAGPAPAAPASAAAPPPMQMTATAGGSTLSVGVNIHLKGVEISNCDALVIEGQVEATVRSKSMQIEKPGTLNGTAVIDVAEIHGQFTGELTARTRLIVHGTGRVSGTIRYGKLVVAEGGELTGDIKQLDGTEEDPQVPLLKPDSRHAATGTNASS